MDELLAQLADTHELTVETDELRGGLVMAIATCSCVRWGTRTMAPPGDRQLLLASIARVHADHTAGADRWGSGCAHPS